ncbi:MAG: site-specific integrase [Bacteroidales bacterium]|nr:site-specific integrase [Bacteroidales bacterium]
MTSALAERRRFSDDGGTRSTRHHSARAWGEVATWLAFLSLEGKATRTLDDYERTIAALLLAFPDHELADFTDAELTRFLMTFPQPSRRIRRAHLASLFKWAFLQGRIDGNPMDRIPNPKRNAQRVITVFEDAEIELLTSLPSPDGALFLILLDAGLRKGEARRLRVRHVNLERRTLTIYQSKGGKDRVVPMTERLTNALADVMLFEGLNRDDFFWYCRPGGGDKKHDRELVESAWHRWYVRSLESAGIPYRNPHTTRHTCATRWQRWGLNLEEIQRLLGHASIQTTSDLYLHLDVEDIALHMATIMEAHGG